MSAGCPVRGCGPGDCLVDACNPGGAFMDALDIVWGPDFNLCAEIADPPEPVRCGQCGTTVRSEADLDAHWDECGAAP